jgi:predicted acetyltransferase
MIYAGIARNDKERESALSLAAASFPMSKDREDSAVLRKSLLLREHPGFTKDSPVIVSASDGSVVGSAFLIDCSLPLKDRMLQGVFISSVSVAKKMRGQGLSRLLMEAAINSCRLRGIDVAMVIARRAVDGYYTRFGFWGLSQYSKTTFEISTLPIAKRSERSKKLLPVVNADLEICAALHAENYRNLVGHCVRKPAMWRYILLKLPYLGMRFDLIKINNKMVGYAIHDGKGNIHEIATVSSEYNFEARTLFEAFTPAISSVTLHVHPTHPFLKKLEGGDILLTLRECPYGGHMVRILNPAAFSGEEGNYDESIQPLGFIESARLFSMARVTCFDFSKEVGLYNSFNIPFMDQI